MQVAIFSLKNKRILGAKKLLGYSYCMAAPGFPCHQPSNHDFYTAYALLNLRKHIFPSTYQLANKVGVHLIAHQMKCRRYKPCNF